MNARIRYRSGAQTDAESIARVNIDTWRSCFRDFVSSSFLKSLSVERRVAAFRGRFQEKDYELIVAENSAGHIIGFCDFGPPRQTTRPHDVELYAIYVICSYQRQGVGRMLFSRAVDAILRQGKNSLFVRVFESNPYRAFYANLCGEVSDAESIELGSEHINSIMYSWNGLSDWRRKECSEG